MSRIRSHVCAVAVGVLMGLATGCGESSQKVSLHGHVVFEGDPVANGEIVFKPTEPGSRPAVGAILDGNYKIPKEFGVVPGNYHVSITARRPSGGAAQNPYAPDAVPTEQYIPQRYNDSTVLQVQIARDSDEHDFNLSNKH